MGDDTRQVDASVLIGFVEELRSFEADNLAKLDSSAIELKTTGVGHQCIAKTNLSHVPNFLYKTYKEISSIFPNNLTDVSPTPYHLTISIQT